MHLISAIVATAFLLFLGTAYFLTEIRRISASLWPAAIRCAPFLLAALPRISMDSQTSHALQNLDAFFAEHPRLAIGFSGGCDSSFLVDAAVRAGVNVSVYLAQSAFQPAFECEDARELCSRLNLVLHIIPVDVLSDPQIADNPPNRCYLCKKVIFSQIIAHARSDGFDTVCDGTNASDEIESRPGWRALQELGVLSPLRISGLTKMQIRKISAMRGLPTAYKPAYACLATRFATGTHLTEPDLRRIESAETSLRNLGFTDFRIRCFHGAARLQFIEPELQRAVSLRNDIRSLLAEYFDTILIDTQTR